MLSSVPFKHFITNKYNCALYFDLDKIESFCQFLKNSSPNNLKVLFPVKSFPNTDFLSNLSPYINGFDISNFNEYSLIEKQLKKESLLWVSSPYLSTELENIPHENLLLDLNSTSDIQTACTLSHENFSLRISTATILNEVESRFGLMIGNIVIPTELKPKINGLHFHLSTEKNTLAQYLRCLKQLDSINRDNKLDVKYLNIGGGQGLLSESEFLELFKTIETEYSSYQVIIEPGKVVSQKGGTHITKILNIIETDKSFHAITASSAESHLRWISAKSTIKIIESNKMKRTSTANKTIHFSGPTCYEKDIFYSASEAINSLSIGDILISSGVNGYCYAWNKAFNGIDEIKIFLHRSNMKTIIEI